jgi:hypothetical protein
MTPTLDHGRFLTAHEEKNFSKWLKDFVQDARFMNIPEVCGISIRTHSLKKGSASTITSGSTGSPNPMTVSLRLCHSLGVTKDAYIVTQPAGAQLASRLATGLNINDSSFEALPPHFTQVLDYVKYLIL